MPSLNWVLVYMLLAYIARKNHAVVVACTLGFTILSASLLYAPLLSAQERPSVRDDAGDNASKANALPPPSASARDLFARYQDRVVQVRVLRQNANEQSSLGSAFVVRNDRAAGVWLITNYHVVSQLAINPEKFRIELRPTSERAVKASLVAIDVIHDLAVLRVEPNTEAAAWPVMTLREKPLVQGEKIFSMGNPLEVGFLISEGIYNGLAESRIYEQMIFSGAINSGMSGGPTIDESGAAVGVNVSTHRRGVLISFLVPIKFARELLASATEATARKEWRTEIARQLRVHQATVTSKLLESVGSSSKEATADGLKGFASQTLSGRNVPTLDASLTKCWAGGRDGERPKFQRDTLSCNWQTDLFVSGSIYTGSIQLSHTFLRNDKLATAQFLNIDQASSFVYSITSRDGPEKTPQECRNKYVQGKAHVYRASICMRAFKKFEGIYDFVVKAEQMDDARERLSSVMTLNGLDYDNGVKLTRLFLGRLE